MAKPRPEKFVPPLTVTEGDYVFASPDMRGRLNKHGKPWTVRTIFVYNVQQVVYRNKKRHAKRAKPVSEATKSHRFIECRAMAHDLHNLGYRLTLPTHIRQKHVKALTRYWESREDLKPSSVIQKVSILRTFLGWMGKQGVMEFMTPADMFASPERMKRDYVSREDKSWDTKTDPMQLIEAVRQKNKFVADQLMLSYLFGLRAKETWLFRPRKDYIPKENIIHVRRGTKGGRPRTVPISSEAQIAFLKELVSRTHHVEDSMTPRTTPVKAWKSTYYRITRLFGISRAEGLTPHGLRHGYAHKVYQELSGHPAAVRDLTSSKAVLDMIEDRIARLIVSENLGHNRESISSAYIGPRHK